MPKTKTVIAISDRVISYVTLSRSRNHFLIDQHESLALPAGIIEQGEILKADVFVTILKKISKNINHKTVDIVLPQDYFLYSAASLGSSSQDSLKKRVQEYFKTKTQSESWHKTHICEFSTYTVDKKEKVLFKCLPKDIQKTYIHVAKKAGLKVHSMNSDILSIDQFVTGEYTTVILFGKEKTRIIDFQHGMYVAHKTFQVSYDQLAKDIEKNIKINQEKSFEILDRYGVLRAHKEEKIYNRLLRSLSPLVEFLLKRKKKQDRKTYILFDHKPLVGLVDYLEKTLGSDVIELDVYRTSRYSFDEVLAVHRSENYQYQTLVAQALKFWNDK